MTKLYTRKHYQAQVRDLPLFRFTARQEQRKQHLSRAEITLRLCYDLSRQRAQLIAELQGYGSRDACT